MVGAWSCVWRSTHCRHGAVRHNSDDRQIFHAFVIRQPHVGIARAVMPRACSGVVRKEPSCAGVEPAVAAVRLI